MMIGYTTVGTNDFPKACEFYDTVLKELGSQRTMDFGEFVLWGTAPDKPGFSITKPFNKEKATAGNGTMVALLAKDQDMVKKVYEAALAAGGSCEGKPGFRGEESMGFYAAYFRDLDGNKLNAFCMVKPS